MDAPFSDGRRSIEVAPPGSSATIALAPLGPGQTPGVNTGIRLATSDAAADLVELRARRADTDPELLGFAGAPPMFSLRDPDGNTLYVVEIPGRAA